MLTTNEIFSYSHEEKKSTFIAFLTPFDLYEKTVEKLKTEHPKARHFVTATRHLNEHDQIVESFSDDGEPKGTSGMPTLKVLQGQNLINVGIITVRYFGGTLLGTGGLVRAYSDAANLVIEEAELLEYIKLENREIAVNYANIGKFEHSAQSFDIKVEKGEFDERGVKMRCIGTAENLKRFFGYLES